VSEQVPESMFIYLLYMICKVCNSFIASVVLFLLIWISVGFACFVYQLTNRGNFLEVQDLGPRAEDGLNILQRLKKIPFTKMLVNMNDSKECVICLVDLVDGDDVLQLKCSKHHIFHYECLSKWI